MADIKRVWNQNEIPVIIRRAKKGQKHRLRLPYSDINRDWLRDMRRDRPVWLPDGKYWEIPKAWFNDFVERCLKRYGQVWIIQPFRESEKCATACMNANGHECQCSCMGGNDGSWFEVSEAFAVRWNREELAARLLVTT